MTRDISQDVFLRDTATGITSRVSVDRTGAEANGPSNNPAISGDGRYVAFGSGAAIVGDDTNNNYDVFLRDRVLGTITRVSVDSAGAEANGDSRDHAISADGRYVAFDSEATNLVGDDSNGSRDVFVHDMMTGMTSRVSVDSTGTQAKPGR